MSFERGTVIAGKYRVERVIGEGGMGIVLAARHLGLDEMVAVKLIREERAEGADALARFQREARAAARIKSEHVARVLDVDRLPEGDPYIVMELIDGTDLQGLVKRRGALPPDEAVTYIMQACEGLAEAHALGMVHRDLKLKNLFLTKRRDGRALIKVIDFGVVKLSPLGDVPDEGDETTLTESGESRALARKSAREATLTGTAVLVGSVHYMAPEQIRASNIVDARADVWSLGVCLFGMLTTELPFEGETIAAVCYAIQGRPAPDVREKAPHVPPELARVVSKALEKDVRRRYQNVSELANALAPFSLDHAAAARIETILQSGIRAPNEATMTAISSAPGAVVSSARRGVLGSKDASSDADAWPASAFDPTVQSDAIAQSMPMGIAKGRVESTIDAAALGSLSAHPTPPPSTSKRNNRMLAGALVAFAAATSTVVIWGRTQPSRGSASADTHLASDGPAQATAMPTNPVPLTTTPPAIPTPVLIAPPTSSLPAATSTPEKKVAGGNTRRPPTTNKPAKTASPAPTPTPTTQPKSEPSSAYDHF